MTDVHFGAYEDFDESAIGLCEAMTMATATGQFLTGPDFGMGEPNRMPSLGFAKAKPRKSRARPKIRDLIQMLLTGGSEPVVIPPPPKIRVRRGPLRRGPAPLEGQVSLEAAYPDATTAEIDALLSSLTDAFVRNGCQWPTFQDCVHRHRELGLFPAGDYAVLGGFDAAVQRAEMELAEQSA